VPQQPSEERILVTECFGDGMSCNHSCALSEVLGEFDGVRCFDSMEVRKLGVAQLFFCFLPTLFSTEGALSFSRIWRKGGRQICAHLSGRCNNRAKSNGGFPTGIPSKESTHGGKSQRPRPSQKRRKGGAPGCRGECEKGPHLFFVRVPSAAKAAIFYGLSARLKSCPSRRRVAQSSSMLA
jgi:hypothetical protein